MTKFKVGDKVRVVNYADTLPVYQKFNGMVGEVTEVRDHQYYIVDMEPKEGIYPEGRELAGMWEDWGFYESTLELVVTGTKPGTLTHKEQAELILQRLERTPGWFGDTPDATVLARAQVHATLALVELMEAAK